MSKSFFPHAVILGSTAITQLTELDASENLVDLTEYSAGDFEAMYTGVQMADPVVNVGTTQIATWLQAMAANGHGTADLSAANVDMWWRAGKPFSARYATTDNSHLRARAESNSMAVLQSIEANGIARLSAQIVPASADGTSPIVWTSGLPLVGTSAATEFFKNGPIKINGSWIKTNGWTYSLNPELEKEEYDGEGFYSWVGVRRFRRQLRFQTSNVELKATFGGNGAAITAGTWYLRRYQDHNHAYQTSDEQHIKFAATSGHLVVSDVRGNKGVLDGMITFNRPSAETSPVVATFDQQIT